MCPHTTLRVSACYWYATAQECRTRVSRRDAGALKATSMPLHLLSSVCTLRLRRRDAAALKAEFFLASRTSGATEA
jgi:hypothetical protein